MRFRRAAGTAPRVLVAGGIIAALLSCLGLGVAARQAAAFETHPFAFSFKLPGEGPAPFSIAINQSTHHVYIVRTHTAIYDYKADGTLNSSHPQLTGAPSGFDPRRAVVDNSGGAFDGYLYVSSLSFVTQPSVQQFNPAGEATSVSVDEADIPANGTPQSGGLPPVVNNGVFKPLSVSVPPSGSSNLFVYDQSNAVIDEFTPAGTFVAQLGTGNQTQTVQIAVGSSGEIYAGNGNGLIELNSLGECVSSCTPIDAGVVEGVAVDAAGNVFAAARSVAGPPWEIREYSPLGALLSASGKEVLGLPTQVAVDEASGKLYVTDEQARDIKVFGPKVILPDVTTEAVDGITDESAIAHGEIGAAGGPNATCVFQYVDQSSFEEHGFSGAQTAACSPVGPFTGTGLQPVEAEASGLTGGTKYHVRLLGTNSNGSNPASPVEFTTLGPTIAGTAFSGVSVNAATLEASVNPNGVATTYSFQYVNQAQFEAGGFAGAAEVPVPAEGIGDGGTPVGVAQTIAGLIPGTGYHFRVVAASSNGSETLGPALEFVTYPDTSPLLPDGRVYEQASPIDKNGANVLGETNDVQAAASGSGITFYSNAGLPGGDGAQTFPTFLASRGPAGWSTQGLLPPASTGAIGELNGWDEELSQVFNANQLASSPAAFYSRSTAPDRSLAQMASGGEGRNIYLFDGVSADGSLVAFENLGTSLATGAAAGKSNVYLWERTSGKLVLGARTNGGSAPPGGALAGSYDWFHSPGSTPGREPDIHYYTQAQHVLSADGSRLFFTAGVTGQLYLRENPTRNQSAISGGQCTQAAKACTYEVSAPNEGVTDPNGPKPAAFLGATPDGSRAFFLSSGTLTLDATTGPGDEGTDLYRYDVATRTLTDIAPDPAEAAKAGAEVQGVLGYSDDGSYVYFAANGVLGDGAAKGATRGDCVIGNEGGECNLYLAHGSEISFISRVDTSGTDASRSDIQNWSPTSARQSAGDEENTARITPDGSTLLFRSRVRLTAYDNHGFTELYRYEAGAPGPVCVSCNPSLAPASGSARLQDPIEKGAGAGPKPAFAVKTRNISTDGRRIFFETPDPLVAGDVNGVYDVYEWEADHSGTCNRSDQNGGCLFLISAGKNPIPSTLADSSASGNDVFFFTAQSLVRQDRDELVDVYDARVGGGIPAQNEPESTPCEGEACAGAATSAPSLPGLESTVPRAGNPKFGCKKGFRKVRRHGHERCVKIKKHRKAKRHHGKRSAKHHRPRGRR